MENMQVSKEQGFYELFAGAASRAIGLEGSVSRPGHVVITEDLLGHKYTVDTYDGSGRMTETVSFLGNHPQNEAVSYARAKEKDGFDVISHTRIEDAILSAMRQDKSIQ
jgi:hypothetical protein